MLIFQNYQDYNLAPGIISTTTHTQVHMTSGYNDVQPVDIQLRGYLQSLKENLLSTEKINGYDGFITIKERDQNNKDQFKADYKYYPLRSRLADKFHDRINQAFEECKYWLTYFSKDEAFNMLKIQDYVKNYKLNILRNVKGYYIQYGDKILPITEALPKKIPSGIPSKHLISKSFKQSLLDEVLKDIVVDRLKGDDDYLKPSILSGSSQYFALKGTTYFHGQQIPSTNFKITIYYVSHTKL